MEFKLTASQPDLWQAPDVVRIRCHSLSRNAPSEVARAQVACTAGLDADLLPAQAGAGLDHQDPGRPRSVRDSRRCAARLRPGDARRRVHWHWIARGQDRQPGAGPSWRIAASRRAPTTG
ncbi:MAG: hypothetical protein WDM85_00030 [Caulobacteraceae bacterium]